MGTYKAFLLTCALFLYGIITVATCAAVWGAETKPVQDVIAALLLALNGYVIYRKAKALGDLSRKNQ
jgi:hypothetical protein